MAAGLTTYVQGELADWIRGTAFATAPVSLTVALSTVTLTDSGSNLVEPPAPDGYARQTITMVVPVHTEGAGTRIANSNALVFGPVVNNQWPTVVDAAVFDNSGNMLFKGPLIAPRTAPIGDTLSWGIETLEFKIK